MTVDRFARQRLLPEVGDFGQQKLAEAELLLSPRLAPEVRRVARLYGEAVGLRGVHLDDNADSLTFRHERFFRHRSALCVGHGAHLALARAAEVLELTSPTAPPPTVR